MSRQRSRKPPRDLAGYWRMEAASVLLVPGLALWFGWPETPSGAIALLLAVIATAGCLVVGTLYWRGLDHRFQGFGRRSGDAALAFADRAESPLILATAAAALATVAAFVVDGATVSSIAAGLLTLLAALEYVNYYHRQLQHFDNKADFRRLWTTGRLRRAHMARDLAAFRRR